jgi:antitoxin component YwqK of YwqJK toxin-antitoxin module
VRLLPFIFVFLILHPLKAQVIDTVFYQEGQVKAYGLLTVHGQEGVWHYLYPDGALNAIENYRNGELQPENGCITTKKAG